MYNIQNPFPFLLLLLIPLYFILKKLGIFRKIALPLTLQDWNGGAFAWKSNYFSSLAAISNVLFVCAYVFLIVALANPIFVTQQKIYTSRSSEVVFVLDASPSMASIDIANGNRLDAAKQTITRLVRENESTAYGLVSCATESVLLVPPTMDHKTFFDGLNSVMIGELGDKTSLGLGISTAVYHLIASQTPRKTIVLLTDGESNSGSIQPETAAKLASDNNIVLYVAGIGTSGSVPIEYVDPHSGSVYSGFLDSSFDSTSLRNLAKVTDGKYFTVQTLAELSNALKTIASESTSTQTYHIKQTENSYYAITLIISLLLFSCAWVIRRIFLQEIL